MTFIIKSQREAVESVIKNKDTNNESLSSYIGESVKIRGNIVSEQSLILKGKVKGNLDINASLTIEQGGDVVGNIKAKTVNIIGKAKGDIKTDDKLSIYPTGKFNGNINSQTIVIKEGGLFSGTANLDKKTGNDK